MSADLFFRSVFQSFNMPFGILSSENQTLKRLFAIRSSENQTFGRLSEPRRSEKQSFRRLFVWRRSENQSLRGEPMDGKVKSVTGEAKRRTRR
jgi:hypothetical protein